MQGLQGRCDEDRERHVMFSVECRCRRVSDYTTLPPLRGTQRIDPNKQIRGSGLRDVLRLVLFGGAGNEGRAKRILRSADPERQKDDWK
jgi:hypothetical protein